MTTAHDVTRELYPHAAPLAVELDLIHPDAIRLAHRLDDVVDTGVRRQRIDAAIADRVAELERYALAYAETYRRQLDRDNLEAGDTLLIDLRVLRAVA